MPSPLMLCALAALGLAAPRAALAFVAAPLHRLAASRVVTGGDSLAASVLSAPVLADTPSASAAPEFRPSITDKARTVAYICSSGTLCTTSTLEDVADLPFGSYVDYILDERGWPVLLLSDQSMHTANIKGSPLVSLFCQLPRSQAGQTTAALSRVTIMGCVETVPAAEEGALKLAFTLIHPYADQLVDSPKFTLYRIKPQRIYFSGGFGVMATWVNVEEYEKAKPDVLAQEVPTVLSRVNIERQGELVLLCKHFLDLPKVDLVRIQAIDRLGIDLRVQMGDFTDEYRIGFRHGVINAEEAKSELMKLFQEAWERDNGLFFADDLPPVTKYAEDILRQKQQRK